MKDGGRVKWKNCIHEKEGLIQLCHSFQDLKEQEETGRPLDPVCCSCVRSLLFSTVSLERNEDLITPSLGFPICSCSLIKSSVLDYPRMTHADHTIRECSRSHALRRSQRF